MTFHDNYEMKLWRQVYVASTRAGYTPGTAGDAADKAVEAYRARLTGSGGQDGRQAVER